MIEASNVSVGDEMVTMMASLRRRNWRAAGADL